MYVTGGYAGVQAKYSSTFTDTFATASEGASKSKFMSGWTVGGGAEFKLSKYWSVQPEFLYAKFGKIAGPGGTLTAFTPAISYRTNVFTHGADLSVDVARVAVQYRF